MLAMFIRFAWLLVVAPLFCLGCSNAVEPPDARQAQFVGTWKEVYQGPKGTLTLKADGTYTGTIATPREHQMLFHAPETIDIKGTWKTTDGEIHFHIDEASALGDALAGQDAVETINKVDNGWFTTTDAKGHEIMYTRLNEPPAVPETRVSETAEGK